MPLLVPGTLAPDFTLSDVDGKPFTLSQQRGSVVVLVLKGRSVPEVGLAHLHDRHRLRQCARPPHDGQWDDQNCREHDRQPDPQEATPPRSSRELDVHLDRG